MSVRIGVVGDFDAGNRTHRFTNAALEHLALDFDWVPTESVGNRPEASLGGYDEDRGLRVSGVGAEGEIRIVELLGHPFFVATLFLPQARSGPGVPHPLLAGYAGAVRARRAAVGVGP